MHGFISTQDCHKFQGDKTHEDRRHNNITYYQLEFHLLISVYHQQPQQKHITVTNKVYESPCVTTLILKELGCAMSDYRWKHIEYFFIFMYGTSCISLKIHLYKYFACFLAHRSVMGHLLWHMPTLIFLNLECITQADGGQLREKTSQN